MQYLTTLEPPEEVCIINNVQKRGTTFPLSIKNTQKSIDSNALMDMGATRSCMNYNTAYRLGKEQIKPLNTMQVVGADGSDLGAVGTILCKISLVEQTFIVCKHLRRNVILGTDFTKTNQAVVSWTRHGTRVLSVRGIPRLEVEEDELGTPVTTKHHIKIPPRYSAVFEVNLHRSCKGTKIISANKQLMEVNPNIFQHEILVKPEGNRYFPLVAITNLDHAKILHLAKGEIVGFTHDEEVEMHDIETTSILEIDEVEQKAPRNWIPERRWRKYKNRSEISPQNTEVLEATHRGAESGKISPKQPEKYIEPSIIKAGSQISRKELQEKEQHNVSRDAKGFETDFLISLGDVYPNRKVKLQNTEITDETRRQFEEMCNRHPEAFSKNNKDIGRTTLIEMEIDTGDNLQVAQNPYTLPLKHHEWV